VADSRSSCAQVRCDAGGLPADLTTVDRLARLALAARRLGCRLVLERASAELGALVCLLGLDEVLGVEVVGQAEQGEQPLGVQKGAHDGDGAV